MRTRPTPAQREAAQKKVLAALKAGATVEAACSYARITKETWYAWQRKDPALKEDHEEALATSELSLVFDIKKDPSWQSKAWLLERRFPERWGRRSQVEISGEASGGFLILPAKPKE